MPSRRLQNSIFCPILSNVHVQVILNIRYFSRDLTESSVYMIMLLTRGIGSSPLGMCPLMSIVVSAVEKHLTLLHRLIVSQDFGYVEIPFKIYRVNVG